MLKVLCVLALLLPGSPPVINKIEVANIAECNSKISEYLERVAKVNETFQAMGQCVIAHEKEQEG